MLISESITTSRTSRPLHTTMRSRARQLLPAVTIGTAAISVAVIRHRHRLRQILHTLRLLTKLARSVSVDNILNNDESLDRILQLAATPHGQSIIRALSSGAVSALTAPSPQQRPAAPTNTSDAGLQVMQVLQALASPHGQQVVSTVVSTAVKEVMVGVTASQNPPISISHLASSEPLRKLILDVVQTITVSAVPHFVRPAPSPPPHHQQQQQQHSYTQDTSRQQSKRLSVTSVSSAMSSTVTSASDHNHHNHTSAKVVADRFVSRTRTASFWERLAIIAIRDRGLVQDIVRVFVTHTVRTYLLTQAELRGDYVVPEMTTQPQAAKPQISSPSSSSTTVTPSSAVARTHARVAASPSNVPPVSKQHLQPVWKLLTRAVAIDLKKLVYSIGSRPASSGWTVF